ncbi:hypothetical protein ACQKJZ_04790 [Sphingomonas sp. NPDC019816]
MMNMQDGGAAVTRDKSVAAPIVRPRRPRGGSAAAGPGMTAWAARA